MLVSFHYACVLCADGRNYNLTALAPTTKPISSSPEEQPELEENEIEELDEEPDMPRPRLSLPMEDMGSRQEDDDGSPDMPPPRLSLLADEEDDTTQRSIEMPRRERPARDLARLSRRSFVSTRFSDHFGDLSRMEDMTERLDETMTHGMGEEEEQIDTSLGQQAFDAG